jgi:hypothetical protein
MTMPLTPSKDNDELASLSRRRMLAGCAGLAAAASLSSWTTRSALAGGSPADLFAFKAPGERDLVFALALSPNSFGRSERDPLTVRLHAGPSSWTVGPFALRDTQDVLSDRARIFSGRIWTAASNLGEKTARLIAVAVPAERVPSGTLEVWAQIIGAGGARWRIGNPVVSEILADDARLTKLHATLRPAMDRDVLSPAIARRIATRLTGGSGVDLQARAKRLTTLMLPDTLRFDSTRPGGFTFAAMNGRRAQDAVDPVVRTVLAGVPRSGRCAGRYRASSRFPYFATSDAA